MFGTAADVASMEKSLDKARTDPAFTNFLQEIGPDLANDEVASFERSRSLVSTSY